MRALLFATALMATATAANAETINFHAMLAGAPPVAGKGMMMGKLDTTTKVFSYDATYSDLTGPATAAHFHGPAAPGANAPPVVPIANPASPIKGEATLTDAQIADLTAGKWYLNVHTAANRGGEIRGQVEAMK